MEHVHLHEIPNKFIRRGTTANNYRADIIRTIRSLQYTDKNVQYSAQIASFNIQALTRQSGFQPFPQDLYDSVEAFVYHYENYCHRLFTFREKCLQFINAALKIGYVERDATIKNLLINPTVKSLKLDKCISRFDTRSKEALGRIVKDRHALTHKLYYGQSTDHLLRPLAPAEIVDDMSFAAWCKTWKEEITSRTNLVTKAEYQVSQVNHELSGAVMKFFSQT